MMTSSRAMQPIGLTGLSNFSQDLAIYTIFFSRFLVFIYLEYQPWNPRPAWWYQPIREDASPSDTIYQANPTLRPTVNWLSALSLSRSSPPPHDSPSLNGRVARLTNWLTHFFAFFYYAFGLGSADFLTGESRQLNSKKAKHVAEFKPPPSTIDPCKLFHFVFGHFYDFLLSNINQITDAPRDVFNSWGSLNPCGATDLTNPTVWPSVNGLAVLHLQLDRHDSTPLILPCQCLRHEVHPITAPFNLNNEWLSFLYTSPLDLRVRWAIFCLATTSPCPSLQNFVTSLVWQNWFSMSPSLTSKGVVSYYYFDLPSSKGHSRDLVRKAFVCPPLEHQVALIGMSIELEVQSASACSNIIRCGLVPGVPEGFINNIFWPVFL